MPEVKVIICRKKKVIQQLNKKVDFLWWKDLMALVNQPR